MTFYELLQQLSTQKLHCPFCNCFISNTDDTHKLHAVSLAYNINGDYNPLPHIICETPSVNANTFGLGDDNTSNSIMLEYIICPNCEKASTIIHDLDNNFSVPIMPRVIKKDYPEYIPEQIRQDYEEACLIAELSPKASATLTRRCLQGMIRDFFKINKRRLVDEIEEVAKASGMSSSQKTALDALRNIGNIGAHPEQDINLIVDVEPDEARLMISLIEFFMQQWYIQKHDEEEMLNNIASIAQQKKNLKNPSQPAN